MASPSFAPERVSGRRISLTQIHVAVSARLGPTRGLGNSQPACFNRQVAMHLAKHIGRWTTTIIGRFYNGRDHSTVCHGIQRIETLRESDPDVDVLISSLKRELTGLTTEMDREVSESQMIVGREDLERLAELVAERVWKNLAERIQRQRVRR
jgi:hypothetical protein